MSKSRQELLQSLVERLVRVMRNMHAGQGFQFAGHTVGAPQVRILFKLAHQPEGTSVKELAEALNVTPGAVTQFIDALVEKDLVHREEDRSDRRLLRIKLTGFAVENFQQFRKDYFAAVRRTFDPLTNPEVEQLIELLGKTAAVSAQKETGK